MAALLQSTMSGMFAGLTLGRRPLPSNGTAAKLAMRAKHTFHVEVRPSLGWSCRGVGGAGVSHASIPTLAAEDEQTLALRRRLGWSPLCIMPGDLSRDGTNHSAFDTPPPLRWYPCTPVRGRRSDGQARQGTPSRHACFTSTWLIGVGRLACAGCSW